MGLFTDHEQQNQNDSWTLYVDGASRNNPGPSGAGIYIEKNDVLFLKDGYFLGNKTNNQAEYFALILGLFILSEHVQKDDRIRIISDSQLLVRQILGMYRVKHSSLQPLHGLCKKYITRFNATISHVLRHENTQADEMANQGLDYKKLPPKKYIEQLKNYDIVL